MNAIDKLTEQISKFPGIGPRQAKRLVYFLLRQNKTYLHEFAVSLENLTENVKQCHVCYRFFSQDNILYDQERICSLCRDSNADSSMMLVLEKDVDLDSFRKSSVYNGKYFILGGSLPFLEKEPTRKIRVDAFVSEVKRRTKEENLVEIIFALSANPEGENTVEYLKDILKDYAEENGLEFSVLGRGLSTGTEIEYSDSDTITNAFQNRR
jgi:recombination protein RecR